MYVTSTLEVICSHEVDHSILCRKNKWSQSISELLHTNPSPNTTLTLTCYQLIVVGLGEG